MERITRLIKLAKNVYKTKSESYLYRGILIYGSRKNGSSACNFCEIRANNGYDRLDCEDIHGNTLCCVGEAGDRNPIAYFINNRYGLRGLSLIASSLIKTALIKYEGI